MNTAEFVIVNWDAEKLKMFLQLDTWERKSSDAKPITLGECDCSLLLTLLSKFWCQGHAYLPIKLFVSKQEFLVVLSLLSRK